MRKLDVYEERELARFAEMGIRGFGSPVPSAVGMLQAYGFVNYRGAEQRGSKTIHYFEITKTGATEARSHAETDLVKSILDAAKVEVWEVLTE